MVVNPCVQVCVIVAILTLLSLNLICVNEGSYSNLITTYLKIVSISTSGALLLKDFIIGIL